MKLLPGILHPLRNRRFARLYGANAVSLLGDALTWVGLALLAWEISGDDAPVVLATALTLRVITYALVAPVGGVLADRWNRRGIMIASDLARVGVVVGIGLTRDLYVLYGLMILLNIFTALFRPAYQAAIPATAGESEYPAAIALSGATYELLGVVGPGLAGGVAALFGTEWLFYLDGGTFLVSAALLAGLRFPPAEPQAEPQAEQRGIAMLWQGSRELWGDSQLRFGLTVQFAGALCGAMVLVNTVLHVQGALGLGQTYYGWIMASFGLGAMVAALVIGARRGRLRRRIVIGSVLMAVAMIPVNWVSWIGLAALWFIAGGGQNWINLPVQTLIADRIPQRMHGRVYGAHFAWSHLWWVVAYPIAGVLGNAYGGDAFPIVGGGALVILLGIRLLFGRHSEGAEVRDRQTSV